MDIANYVLELPKSTTHRLLKERHVSLALFQSLGPIDKLVLFRLLSSPCKFDLLFNMYNQPWSKRKSDHLSNESPSLAENEEFASDWNGPTSKLSSLMDSESISLFDRMQMILPNFWKLGIIKVIESEYLTIENEYRIGFLQALSRPPSITNLTGISPPQESNAWNYSVEIDSKSLIEFAKRKWEQLVVPLLDLALPSQNGGASSRFSSDPSFSSFIFNSPSLRSKSKLYKILNQSGLIDDHYTQLTPNGYTFLLSEIPSQIWTLVNSFLAKELSHELKVDAISFLIYISSTLKSGIVYKVDQLSKIQNQILTEFENFGLVRRFSSKSSSMINNNSTLDTENDHVEASNKAKTQPKKRSSSSAKSSSRRGKKQDQNDMNMDLDIVGDGSSSTNKSSEFQSGENSMPDEQFEFFTPTPLAFQMISRRQDSSTDSTESSTSFSSLLSSSGNAENSIGDWSNGIIVESNFYLYLYTDSSILISLLELFAQIVVRLPNMCVARLTRQSVRAAFKRGIHASHMIEYLRLNKHVAHARLKHSATISELSNQNSSSAQAQLARALAASESVSNTTDSNNMDAMFPTSEKSGLPEQVEDQLMLWEEERFRFQASHIISWEFERNDPQDVLSYPKLKRYASDINCMVWSNDRDMILCVKKDGQDELVRYYKSLMASQQ